MPLILDSLNLMFLGAVAVVAGGLIKANPDLTKPHPDSAYGKWQAKKREKVSHDRPRVPPHRSARAGADDVVRRAARDARSIPPSPCARLTMPPARVSRRDPSSLAEACRPPLTVHR